MLKPQSQCGTSEKLRLPKSGTDNSRVWTENFRQKKSIRSAYEVAEWMEWLFYVMGFNLLHA